jgi:hypothetical protein
MAMAKTHYTKEVKLNKHLNNLKVAEAICTLSILSSTATMSETDRIRLSSASADRILLSLLVLLCFSIDNGSAFSIGSWSTRPVASVASRVKQAGCNGVSLRSSKMSDEEKYQRRRPSFTSPEEDPISPHPDNRSNGLGSQSPPNVMQRILDEVPFIHLFTEERRKKLPPIQVDDVNVMLYDVFLIVNLSLSISFWVTHRMDFSFLPAALNEGCLFSILWIASGLYHGSFLYSAMDGHYPPDDPSGRGGPKEAAALAFNTFVNAINLRLVAALLGAWLQHRQVGMDGMEQLIPLEIGCGIVLMTLWRALHSSFTPRV